MPKQCCKEFWDKIADDEPVFILAGRDAFAGDIVDAWIAKALKEGVNRDKIDRATQHLIAIRQWQNNNPHRVKLPD